MLTRFLVEVESPEDIIERVTRLPQQVEFLAELVLLAIIVAAEQRDVPDCAAHDDTLQARIAVEIGVLDAVLPLAEARDRTEGEIVGEIGLCRKGVADAAIIGAGIIGACFAAALVAGRDEGRAAERRRIGEIVDHVRARSRELRQRGDGLGFGPVERVIGAERPAIVERQRDAEGIGVVGTRIAARFGVEGVDEPVGLLVEIAELGLEPAIAQFARVERALGLPVAAVAVRPRHFHAEFVGGLARNQADRAARGVAAIERALRAAQHLDTLQIDELEHRAGRAADDDAVDIDADGRVCGEDRFGFADAPHLDDEVPLGRRTGGGGEVRRDRAEHRGVGDAARFDRIGADRADRERDALQRFTALFSGDDDVVERGRLVAAILRPGGSRQADGRSRYTEKCQRPYETGAMIYTYHKVLPLLPGPISGPERLISRTRRE